ncbi:hypothetical protein [Dyadobacter pollutisoli]|uniref:Uncharacterized protein n=1 Tax=Dyadobacter pollutisoli TaxID=2910158 RepID=A0A9E8SJ13_9BACT|nr:hypothetical protein [Dyadobacter pollutisoli]WAC10398.1 hypothetical protein ON006_21900 [Dyadobacter pollutisoli]
MSSSAALYQILYQHETLFHLGEYPVQPVAEVAINEPEVKETAAPVSKTAVASPVLETPVIANVNVAPVQAPPAPVSASFPALKHSVLILIDEPKQKEMIVSESLFLDNILKAVGHSTETSDILNFSFLPGQDARTVLAEKSTNFFITFGVPLIKLQLDLLLMPYTPKMVDGIWFLLTDPLVVIEADRNLKKKLWQALQKMFEMS